MSRRLLPALSIVLLFSWLGAMPLRGDEVQRPWDEILATPVTVAFSEAPLTDVAAELARLLKAPIAVDATALAEAELDIGAAVTLKVRDVPLESVLHLLLDARGLTWLTRDNALVITSAAEAADRLELKFYRAAKLARLLGGGDHGCRRLKAIVQASVAPDTWDDVGGPGSITVLPSQLAVSTNPPTHRELRRFLDELKHALGLGPVPPLAPSVAAVQRALTSKVNLKTSGTTLADFRDWLADHFEISVVIDAHADQEEAEIALDVPITVDVSGRELRQGLTEILAPMQLAWRTHHDVLFITTSAEAQTILPLRFYHVGDLLAHGRPGAMNETTLRELITSTVAPDEWEDVGGPGAVAVITAGVWLVSQSEGVHDQLKQRLEQVRAAVRAAEEEALEAGGDELHADAADDRDLERVVYRLEGVSAEDAAAAIRGTIAPGSWDTSGGAGALFVIRPEASQPPAPADESGPAMNASVAAAPNPRVALLVVRQTPEVQREIGELLAALGVPPPIRAAATSFGSRDTFRPID